MPTHSPELFDTLYCRGVQQQPLRVPPSAPARLVVLASGTGSLLASVLDAAVDDYPARVVAVGADRDCAALQIAAAASLPTYTVRLGDHGDRDAWDAALTEATAAHEPDLVVSAGFMKILGPQFLTRFPGRVVNTHPALLPAFPGAHAVPATLAYGVKVTGCTVHLVDVGTDTGPILASSRFRSWTTTTRAGCTSGSRSSNDGCLWTFWKRWPPAA